MKSHGAETNRPPRRHTALAATLIVAAALAGPALATRPEPENTPDPATRTFPHIDWCRNYVGGTPKVLFIANSPSAWDVYGLAMRMDVKYDVFYTGGRHSIFAPTTDYYHEGIRLYPEAVRELRALLEKDWDVIAFVDTPPYCLPTELHYRVLEKVKDGTGAVAFNCGRWNTALKQQAGVRTIETSDVYLSLPRSALSVPKTGTDTNQQTVISPTSASAMGTRRPVQTPYELQPLTVHELGKGRIINVVVGGANWGGGPAMQPAMPQAPEELLQAEYFYSLAAKLVLQAAGRPPAVAITTERIDGQVFRPGDDLTFTVALSDTFYGKARLVIRTPQRDVVHESVTRIKLDPGRGSVTLRAPPLPGGRYYVDVWLLDGRRTVDWASAHIVVRDEKLRLLSGAPDRLSYARKDVLSAAVRVTGAGPDTTLTASIRDAFNRILVKKEGIAVTGNQAAVTLPLERTREQYHVFELELRDGDRSADRSRTPFFVVVPWENDLCAFTSADGNNLHGQRRLELFREHGITTLQVQGPHVDQALASGCHLCARLRVNGGCSQWEGGCISSPTYPAAIEETFRLFASTYQPYGLKFLSVGDDSGVAQDFCGSYPAWVRSYVVKLARKYNNDINAFRTAHGTKHLGAFRYVMAQSKLDTILGFKLVDDELDLMKDAWRENYGTIEAFNRASGTAFADFESVTAEDIKQIKQIDPCVLGFRDAMARKYGQIANLNSAWGTELKTFEEITNPLVETLLTEKKVTAKLDKTWQLEELFLKNMESIARGVRSVLPEVGIGMGAASLGNILPDTLARIDSIMPYKGDRDIEIIRSVPHRFCGHTIGVYGGKKVPASARENQAWEVLFTGGNFIWFWDVAASGVMGDLSTNPGRSGVMLRNIREMQQGIGRALINAKRLHNGIAILDSRRAGAVSGFLKELGTQASSQVGFQRIIEDLGMQYRYTWTREVESGVLRTGEFTALILPYAQTLSDGEQAEIRAFVEAGGQVIADLRVATRDWNGNALDHGALDDLFGMRQDGAAARPIKAPLHLMRHPGGLPLPDAPRIPGLRGDASVTVTGARSAGTIGDAPAVLVNSVGQGRTVFLNHSPTTYNIKVGRNQADALRELYRSVFAEGGAQARFRTVLADGTHAAGAELAVFKNGPVEYLTVEKASYEFERYPLEAVIRLDKAYEVYNTRTAQYVGNTDAIPITLTGLGCYVYTLLPYSVGPFTMSCPDRVPRGGEAVVTTDLGADTDQPGPHTVRVDVYRPDGKRLWPINKTETEQGQTTLTIPIAWNETLGKWRIVATDVTTGRHVEQALTVTP